jgi:hypothetical protein
MGHEPSPPLRETMVGNGVESGGSGRGPATVDGVRPVYRARAAAAPVPYIVLRPATLAPGSFRENNEQ